MTDYVIPNHLGRQLDEQARREQRERDDLLQEMLDERKAKADRDEAIHLSVIRSLYPLARQYWREVGDEKRLALTDAELDEQFWLIDQDGIPRLKEDEGTFERRPNPLLETAGFLEDAPEDLSTSVRQTMKEIFRRKAADD